MSAGLSSGLGFAAVTFALLTGFGIACWLTGMAEAAKITAEARLQEAKNARRTQDQNRGGED